VAANLGARPSLDLTRPIQMNIPNGACADGIGQEVCEVGRVVCDVRVGISMIGA